ncbi:drs2 neo1 protein, partial [Coemansia helicoidea]
WFLRCLALCHTVQPDRDPLTGRITGYQATSPDEKALVAAAAELGYVMNNRAGPLVQLRVVAQDRMRAFNRAVSSGVGQPAGTAAAAAGAPASDERAGSSDSGSGGGGGGEDGGGGEPSADESFDRGVPAPHVTDSLGNYEVLDVLEFSSARKRMSVILRCPDGRIVMMAKGADSAIWPRLCAVDRLRSDPGDLSFMPRPTPPARARPGAGQTRRRPSGLGPVARLADDRMYFGELGIGARRILSGTDSSAVSGDDGPDADGPLRSPSHARLLSHAPQHRRLLSESQLSTVSDASSFADATGRVEVPAAFGAPTGEEEAWARARALEALHQFSTEGLRTLAYAHREIEPGAYESWHARYVQATTALANRQQQIEAVCEEIERDLLLSGVSAIEDR